MTCLARSTFSAESDPKKDRKSAATAIHRYLMENAANCICDVEAPF